MNNFLLSNGDIVPLGLLRSVKMVTGKVKRYTLDREKQEEVKAVLHTTFGDIFELTFEDCDKLKNILIDGKRECSCNTSCSTGYSTMMETNT